MNISIAHEPSKSKKNILIAQMAGWSVYGYWLGTMNYWMAVAPHTEIYTPAQYEQLVELHGDYARRKNESMAWADAPDYMGNMSAAESLLDSQDDLIFAAQPDGNYSCEILQGHDKATGTWAVQWLGEGETRSEAFGNALYDKVEMTRVSAWLKRLENVTGSQD